MFFSGTKTEIAQNLFDSENIGRRQFLEKLSLPFTVALLSHFSSKKVEGRDLNNENLSILQDKFELTKTKINDFRSSADKYNEKTKYIFSQLQLYSREVYSFIISLDKEDKDANQVLKEYDKINYSLKQRLCDLEDFDPDLKPQNLLLKPLTQYLSDKGYFVFHHLLIKEYFGLNLVFIVPSCYPIKDIDKSDRLKSKDGDYFPIINLDKSDFPIVKGREFLEPGSVSAYGACIIYPDQFNDALIEDWKMLRRESLRLLDKRDYLTDFKKLLPTQRGWKVASAYALEGIFSTMDKEEPFKLTNIQEAILIHERSHLEDFKGDSYIDSISPSNCKTFTFKDFLTCSYNYSVHSEIKSMLTQIIESKDSWIGITEVLLSFIDRKSDLPIYAAKQWIGKEFGRLAYPMDTLYKDIQLKNLPDYEAKGILTLPKLRERPTEALEYFRKIQNIHKRTFLNLNFSLKEED